VIDFETLPDYLAPNLDLVFIGINPGTFSVRRGHYFARGTTRFWPALSASKLSLPIRQGLGIPLLRPEHDVELRRFGIGLTDVVKRPTANAAELDPHEFEVWVPRLITTLRRYKPNVACFHGLTGYRPFLKYGLKESGQPILGAQTQTIGQTKLFVVPNPSGANAHFTVADQSKWYDQLADFIAETKRDVGLVPHRVKAATLF
jgi:TDG/mug DNA glycosylase family protein